MKKVLIIIITLLVLIAIPASVILVEQRQELRKKAAPAATLSLTPSSVSKNVGDTFSLDVTIDTGENQVVAAEIHLIFNPEKLEALTITNSSLFSNILTSGIVDRGTASITVGAADVSHPVRGTGTVAIVRFKALDKTDAAVSVSFSQNTYVGGLGETQTNVLVGTTPATIIISQAASVQSTITPSPSPTGTTPVTPTPTTQITLTPTPTQPATSSAVATSSAITVTNPSNNSVVATKTPTIKGKALPNATVTLTIYSNPKTVVVTTNATGNWSYTSPSLEEGPHYIVASAHDASGNIQTSTISFVVASGAGNTATQSATPVSGDTSTTYILLFSGLTLLLFGILIPVANDTNYG